jgi:hypothetical protein
MGQPHFKELGMKSFFGDLVYQRIVPRDHFLVKLNQLFNWDAFVPLLLPAYEGLAEEDRRPYSPIVLLKCSSSLICTASPNARPKRW